MNVWPQEVPAGELVMCAISAWNDYFISVFWLLVLVTIELGEEGICYSECGDTVTGGVLVL